jgi:hypothetical protein
MTNIVSLNTNIEQIGAGFGGMEPIWGIRPATTTAAFLTGGGITGQNGGGSTTLPVVTGVTNFIPQRVDIGTSGVSGNYLVAKLINLGSLTLGDGAGGASSWSAGSAMPTVTILGQSTPLASGVIAEVTTVLNAAPGTITVTYVDQDGNAGEATASLTPTNSSVVGSLALLRLNSPDVAVRSISTGARAAGTNPSGVIKFWGLIPISICLNFGATHQTTDLLLGKGFMINRFQAGDVIGVFNIFSSSARAISGAIHYVAE